MNKNKLPNYFQITIKQKDGMFDVWNLQYQILGSGGNIVWLAIEPKPVVGETGGKTLKLTDELIAQIEVKPDGTLFLDLSE